MLGGQWEADAQAWWSLRGVGSWGLPVGCGLSRTPNV